MNYSPGCESLEFPPSKLRGGMKDGKPAEESWDVYGCIMTRMDKHG